MAYNANGQISYLVLDSLVSGAKYGLEIIEYISKKTGGTYILKKPTLYSCLTRMEKKGLVSSSYWGESELGGKRHYYSITKSGRESLEELSRLFANASYSNLSDDDGLAETETQSISTSSNSEPEQTSGTKILQQENIFNMVKETKPETIEEDEEDDVAENQIDIFNMEPLQTPTIEQTETATNDKLNTSSDSKNADYEEKMAYYQSKLEHSPDKQDDAVFLKDDERIVPVEKLTPDQEEQNKRIYDTSSELKKYRKKKSFSENQIEMSVVYEDENYDEIQKERIAELKKSLLNLKQNGFNEEEKTASENTYSAENTPEIRKPQSIPASNDNLMFEKEFVGEEVKNLGQPKEKERVDDAIFITEPRISDEQIPIQRKISPPNIDVNIYADNLPAPKRNSELEPTYKDMMAKLFERKKEKEVKPQPSPQTETENVSQSTSFTDYGSLKKYYQTHGIAFNEYKKTNIERNHNTNLLNMITSAFLLLLSGVGCAILYGIIAGTGNARTGTNFMFYTLPIIFLALTIFDLLRYKFSKSKKATLFYNDIVNWVIFLLGTIIVVVINVICNMQVENFGAYSTTLFVPIFGLLLAFPINFYIRKFLYKRYGK